MASEYTTPTGESEIATYHEGATNWKVLSENVMELL